MPGVDTYLFSDPGKPNPVKKTKIEDPAQQTTIFQPTSVNNKLLIPVNISPPHTTR